MQKLDNGIRIYYILVKVKKFLYKNKRIYGYI